ncbi:DUF4231 domain-containing protein [Streptomyces hokutonensis]|uniref:DUF4231 domain-containing protein n=1 Tax=Streptomyces hokutonensis TaxID=1306990 RepID=UPI0009984F38|nr:DUF4231 domain-containing protein [Streptomyces hokutonensis]
MNAPSELTAADLPTLFSASDSASLSGQRRYIFGTRWRLVLSVAVAVVAAFTFKPARGVDVTAIASAIFFLLTLIIEVWLLIENPEKAWYDGRALAESVKTLAWRYAVAAEPFPKSLGNAVAADRFHSELQALLRDAPADSLAPVGSALATDRMQQLRRARLEERKHVYLRDRIENQQGWYTSKAKFNAHGSRKWRIALIAIELAGVTAAVLRVTGAINFDLPGIMAGMVGAGAAWFAVRQYESLARAYTFAATELTIVHGRLQRARDEMTWAQEVADAEEAISREHTMWRASRGAL